MPSRSSDASRARSSGGATCRRPLAAAGPDEPGLGGDHHLVPGHRRAPACRSAARRRPSPYTSAVSIRVPPASHERLQLVRASCSSVSRPQVMVPRPSRDTCSPLRPDCRCSMHGRPLTGRRPSSRRRAGPDECRGSHEARAEPRLLGRRQRRRQPRPRRRGRASSATTSSGPRRRTAPTPRPCSPGWPPRPSGSASAAAVIQIPARTPAMTAMTAATLDRCPAAGSGWGWACPGPQVSEGWHGVRFDQPLGPHPRVRRHRATWRCAARRVAYAGRALPLPLPDGPGKALQLTVAPGARAHADLPGRGRAEEPRAGRRDRGRLAGDLLHPRARRRAARPRSGAGRSARPGTDRTAFDVVPTVPVVVGDDLERAAPSRSARTPRCTSAAWAPGSRTSTTQLAVRMGYERGGATRCRTSTWPASTRAPRRRCRSSSSTHLPARASERIAARLGDWPGGVTTAAIAPYGDRRRGEARGR